MPQLEVRTYGIQELEAAFRDLGPSSQAQLLGPALGRMANVVRRRLKPKDVGFRDRRRRLGYPDSLATGRYRDLRQSIRARRIRGTYGGRTYKRGRAAVFAGGRGSGAAQAYLVEEGHGGPRPASPRRYLYNTALQTRGEQATAFQENLRRRYPALAARLARRTSSYSAQHSFARTVSRRARSRR